MSDYGIAIELTTQVIGKRARVYRNLIVVVVVTGLAPMVWALAAWFWAPLLGLLLLFPICLCYFLIDARLTAAWRSRLLASWIAKDIDFYALRSAVNAISMLPKATLQAMLDTLPGAADLKEEQAISTATRSAIAARIVLDHARQADALAVKAAGIAVLTGCVILAAALPAWKALLGNALILLAPPIRTWIEQVRRRKFSRQFSTVQLQPGFDQETYNRIMTNLDG